MCPSSSHSGVTEIGSLPLWCESLATLKIIARLDRDKSASSELEKDRSSTQDHCLYRALIEEKHGLDALSRREYCGTVTWEQWLRVRCFGEVTGQQSPLWPCPQLATRIGVLFYTKLTLTGQWIGSYN